MVLRHEQTLPPPRTANGPGASIRKRIGSMLGAVAGGVGGSALTDWDWPCVAGTSQRRALPKFAWLRCQHHGEGRAAPALSGPVGDAGTDPTLELFD